MNSQNTKFFSSPPNLKFLKISVTEMMGESVRDSGELDLGLEVPLLPGSLCETLPGVPSPPGEQQLLGGS